ncbi:MAG TPA: apolipoprotein N-acyltransferase [Candidatus Melainabacteria bacterium]|nr:apolipoprotein N-acyltransferase [Candidatus Melainabacteria bacterium]
MTKTAEKRQSKKEAKSKPKKPQLKFSWPSNLGLAVLGGALLGLSAPGITIPMLPGIGHSFSLSFLAWFALAPLLLLTASSKSTFQAFLRGTVFGTAYNLVYQNWYLGLQPLDWLGFNQWQGWALAILAWFVIAVHQGLIIGLFSAAAYLVPTTGQFFPEGAKKRIKLPAFFILPLLWVLIVNKLGNAHIALGVPFAMLEYTQYKQISLIQIASIIGGIGLSYLMVMCNTVFATLIANFSKMKGVTSLQAPSRSIALYQCFAMALILTGMLAFGFYQSSTLSYPANIPVSVVQQNINIDMQKTKMRYGIDDLFRIHRDLMMSAPKGLSVWTESALPTYLNREKGTQQNLKELAMRRGTDIVVGAMDTDSNGRPYNSAFGITSGGKILENIYHKRYLVPVGEYAPPFLQVLPEWARRMTNTPAGGGFNSGSKPEVFEFASARVGPLICFEIISPEEVASTVREGAQVLVNISDLAWFHDSLIGEQMIATSVMRAVENRRFVIFAANTGPSAVIDPLGRVQDRCGIGKAQTLTGKIGTVDNTSIFTSWYRL